MKDSISKFEQNENWQATAKRTDGTLVAVMKGAKDKKQFYLYEENFTFAPPPAPQRPPEFAQQPHTTEEIRVLFASAELSLLRGKIP